MILKRGTKERKISLGHDCTGLMLNGGRPDKLIIEPEDVRGFIQASKPQQQKLGEWWEQNLTPALTIDYTIQLSQDFNI